ncbi:hypothetical protein FQA39_LY17224 [Lamprigera yunnana]|nr:hypothetical protein FQA39_LY17224 [Lamprigera yunnana]
MFNTTFTRSTDLDVDSPIPRFSGRIREDPGEFLREMEAYFHTHTVPKSRRLATATAGLTEDAAAWWRRYEVFVDSYEEFDEMMMKTYDSEQVRDHLTSQFCRRHKRHNETMSEFLTTKGAIAKRVKLDDAEHIPQIVDMFGPAVLPYLRAPQSAPPIHKKDHRECSNVVANDVVQCREPQTRQRCEQQDNADAEVYDVQEIDQDESITDDEPESHVNSECNELVVTAEEAELPANDGDAEVDVGRDEIHTDEEVEHRTDPEGNDEVLEKVEEEIVREQTETPDSIASELEGQDLESLDHFVEVVLGNLFIQEGKQRQVREGHVLSGTQSGEIAFTFTPVNSIDIFKRQRHSEQLLKTLELWLAQGTTKDGAVTSCTTFRHQFADSDNKQCRTGAQNANCNIPRPNPDVSTQQQTLPRPPPSNRRIMKNQQLTHAARQATQPPCTTTKAAAATDANMA